MMFGLRQRDRGETQAARSDSTPTATEEIAAMTGVMFEPPCHSSLQEPVFQLLLLYRRSAGVPKRKTLLFQGGGGRGRGSGNASFLGQYRTTKSLISTHQKRRDISSLILELNKVGYIIYNAKCVAQMCSTNQSRETRFE